MPNVMWTGPETVRIILKADLGIEPDSTEQFEWSPETRHMQEMTDEEFTKLVELTGPGTWATVEVSPAEEVPAPAPKTKTKVTPADESSSDQA